MQVNDVEASHLLNDALGKQNLNTFIVQTEDDMHLLRSVRGSRGKNTVRVVLQTRVDLVAWNKVGTQYSKETLQSFAGFGFRKFLRDFVECDDVVKTFLGGSCRAAIESAYARTSNKAS